MSTHGSLIYSSPVVYRALMRVLYGGHFRDRYRALAELVPPGASVLDVCAADCYLYWGYLRQKPGISYVGLDMSPSFVRTAQRRGTDARVFNVLEDEFPAADVVIMQGSLYQFLPGAERVVDRMLDAARRHVIIAEPIRNLSDSNVPVLSALSRWLTKPQSSEAGRDGARFTEQALRELFSRYDSLERTVYVPGGRELIGVFRGRCAA